MTEAPEKVTIGFFGHVAKDVVIVGEGDQYVSDKPVDYSRADLPPKVKALVWSDAVRYKRRAGLLGGLSCGSQNPTGNYSVDGFDGDTSTNWHSYFRGDAIGKDFATQEDAKAAAQAHYEALVLGCLDEYK